jgi:hypothetical protein
MARAVTPTSGWFPMLFSRAGACCFPAMVLLQFSQCEKGFVLRALVKMGVGVGLMGVGYRLGGQMTAFGAKIGKQNQLAHRWGILLGDNRFSSPMCKVIYLLWILI